VSVVVVVEPEAPSATLVVLLVLAVVLTATSGGVLFAFSSFVTSGLARLDAADGAAAMQSLNITAVRPAFMSVFFGAAVIGVAAAVVAYTEGFPAVLPALGAAVYLAGVIGVTAVVNVPLNSRLAAVPADEAARSGLWEEYLRRWTAANHVRSLAGALAAALVVLSLVV
jgi:uncharacterized membrane protein